MPGPCNKAPDFPLASLNYIEKLADGIAGLGQDPGTHPLQQYIAYLEEMQRWNKAYNLTAIRDMDDMIIRHILDSLSVLPWISGEQCLDVGTGAGLPGLVLALARPELHWVLLDSKIKKIRFLHHVRHTLNITNIEPVHARVEGYSTDKPFTTIITRALADLETISQLTAQLKGDDCRLLAMKGKYPEQELAALPADGVSVQRLTVPGLDSERFLIIIN